MTISSPEHFPDHPDRVIDCEFAMEPKFQALAGEAIDAGWTADEVAQGMLNLAAAQIRRIAAERRTKADIGAAKQIIRAMKGQ